MNVKKYFTRYRAEEWTWESQDKATQCFISLSSDNIFLLEHFGPITGEAVKRQIETIRSITRETGISENNRIISDGRQAKAPGLEVFPLVKEAIDQGQELFDQVVFIGSPIFSQLVNSMRFISPRHFERFTFARSIEEAFDIIKKKEESVSKPGPSRNKMEAPEPNPTDVIKQQIDNDPGATLNLDQFCTRYGVHRVRLWELFRRQYGVSPKQYHTAKKLEIAEALLKDGALVTTVAEDLGFSNRSHFSRTFQKYYNQRPREFQKRWASVKSKNPC